MAKSKNNAKTTKVDSIKHKDKRANIPTEELRDFVAEEEASPKTMLYPRDPSLDPQLVWKGKDEQDATDLKVPVVPIYIQEKIHPHALIEDLIAHATIKGNRVAEKAAQYQATLFADFNGLPSEFDQRVDFYHHEGHWSNRMILGDSLMVMCSLAEKEGLKGKVQCIYIDPPYGIRFGSNWQVSTRKRDVKDGKSEDATRQPEQVRAFRDTWKLGIHSYLSYLRDRFVVARELLTETGSCFVQIGDENVHLVRSVLDEVFGSDNFIVLISFQKTTTASTDLLPVVNDYLLWYAKKKENVKYRQLFSDKKDAVGIQEYKQVESPNGAERRKLTPEEESDRSKIPEGWRLFRQSDVTSQGWYDQRSFEYEYNGEAFRPGADRHWSISKEGLDRLASLGRLIKRGHSLAFARYLSDQPVFPVSNNWTDVTFSSRSEDKIYVVQSSDKVITRCLLMTTDPGDLVLDPTCGSGTTAYVAEQWGRRWITIDTSRVALALARTRLMSARYPSYYLAEQYPEWGQFGADETSLKKYLRSSSPSLDSAKADIRKGFVYKRVPHVTLKSIANNPDIREGMSREEIDAAIARHAESETLYDQPYEDNKTVRVCGPFSVESLSPHRVLASEDADMDGNITPKEEQERGDFALMIIDNLRKAGVQNTRKNERLKFETLEPYAGKWLQAKGTYEENGTSKRAAISIGPEHGTVGPSQVKEAAKEAVQGVGFDLLIVCGFAFDPHVAEEVKRYGKLTVLPTRMNSDLSMGDELLKKTGAGNLFMVFGEPDLKISKSKGGDITIEIKGVDVYDPTTGEIRSSTTDDIACWFIDTDYNGESFFVRHAYFTGAEEPYEKLKRALRAEIDEAAWTSLYSTVSLPFSPPKSGKVAVKVINHYGDEVLKVFEV